MNIYRVTFEKYNGASESRTVFAPDVQHALDDFKRFARKQYWSSITIIKVECDGKVDIFYKSPERKKRKAK